MPNPQPDCFNPFRVIPCLLMTDGRAVKTRRFAKPEYVGDILNIVKIFNEKMVDEIAIIDIGAARSRKPPNLSFLADLASECFMPLAYGGGISNAEQVRQMVSLGVEKVILNTAALESPQVLREAAAAVGSQSVVASLDVGYDWLGRAVVRARGGSRKSHLSLEEAIDQVEESGAGELIIHAVDRDGCLSGMDITLTRRVTARARIPVVAMGGARSNEDIAQAVVEGGASAVAAGAMFIFRGPHRAVLPSYPNPGELNASVADRRSRAP